MKFTLWANERALLLALLLSAVVFYLSVQYLQPNVPLDQAPITFDRRSSPSVFQCTDCQKQRRVMVCCVLSEQGPGRNDALA